MAIFDAHKNFAKSTVAVPPSPATTGASLTVATGDGPAFPTPPFNATVSPASAEATNANAEIVRVTAIAGDVLTITRGPSVAAPDTTPARAIGVGDRIAATQTAKTYRDLEVVANPANVLAYGADPTGVADSTAACAAAAAAGNLIYVPGNAFRVDGPLEIAGKTLRGEGKNATVLQKNSLNGSMITITPGASHLTTELRDLQINHITTTPTSGSTIKMAGNGSGARLHNFEIVNPYQGVEASATDGGWNDLVEILNFRIYNANNYGIYVHDNPNPVSVGHGTVWMNGAVGACINLQNQVAAFVCDDLELIKGIFNIFTGSTLNTHGNRPEYLEFSGVYCDSATGAGGNAAPVVALTNCALVKWKGGWISAATPGSGSGAELTACESVKFIGLEFANCPHYGCYVNASTKRARFLGAQFLGNSTAAANTYDGLYIAPGTTDFSVIGGDAVSNGVMGGTMGWGTQRYGVNVAAGASDRYTIMGVGTGGASGNGTGGVNDGGTGTNKLVQGNF